MAEQALTRLRDRLMALAQAVAAAAPPPFPIAEVQAIRDERGTAGETDPLTAGPSRHDRVEGGLNVDGDARVGMIDVGRMRS